MKVKIAESSDQTLAWLVGMALGYELNTYGVESIRARIPGQGVIAPWRPSYCWKQGGSIIEQLRSDSAYQFLIESDGDNVHVLSWPSEHVHFSGYGPTILIAALRCYATSKLGEEIEVLDKLLET